MNHDAAPVVITQAKILEALKSGKARFHAKLAPSISGAVEIGPEEVAEIVRSNAERMGDADKNVDVGGLFEDTFRQIRQQLEGAQPKK